MLPQDPIILYSYINTLLRDEGLSLDELCEERGIERETLESRLAEAGFVYDPARRRFF